MNEQHKTPELFASTQAPCYTVLDLFSGIGGFSLGLERTGGFRTIAFCEIEPFPRKVLVKHWPNVPIFEDVRKLHARDLPEAVDVICGGFPCQDISRAGKMEGLKGKQSSLWREMCRLVEETNPKFVLAENVARLCADGLAEVLNGLSEIGYDAEWHCIPGYTVGSPQERDRVYIVAYPVQQGLTGRRPGWVGRWLRSKAETLQDGWGKDAKSHVQLWPEPNVDRVAYGLPSQVDRINSLGNAVIPEIPELIGRAILAV